MQISENLPQFDDENVLIIVSSTQSADIYQAADGEIELVEEIRTEKIDPDKPAGHFERKKGGQTLGGGGVEEDRGKRLKDRFNQELQIAFSKLKTRNFDQVILLSSPQDRASTKEQLPTQLERLLTVEIDGNFVGDHPSEILERIQVSE